MYKTAFDKIQPSLMRKTLNKPVTERSIFNLVKGWEWQQELTFRQGRTGLVDGNVLKLRHGYGRTTLNIYRNSLNYTLKMYALMLHKFCLNKAVKINSQQWVGGEEA